METNSPVIKSAPIRDDLNREESRLQTFNNWPHNFITPQQLARTGFYFIGPNNDNVKCYFCKVEINSWEQDDNEVTEHMRWAQHCPLLRRRETNNVPIEDGELDRLLPPPTYDVCGPCGVVDVRHESYAESSFVLLPTMEPSTLKHPDYPEYAIESVRFRSYEDWPKVMTQKPKDLSDAGFFYTQTGDKVKCFSCGGILRDWDENDVPWEQHALWFSKCEYVKLIKGESYINSIRNNESESGTYNNDKRRTNMGSPVVTVVTSSGYDNGSSKSKLCKICYTCDYNTVFLPCGHIVACAKCASSITKCPVCRNPYERIVRVYLLSQDKLGLQYFFFLQ